MGFVETSLDPPMKTGCLPQMRAGDETVLHGVVVDVIEVLLPLVFVADFMLPEAALRIVIWSQSIAG